MKKLPTKIGLKFLAVLILVFLSVILSSCYTSQGNLPPNNSNIEDIDFSKNLRTLTTHSYTDDYGLAGTYSLYDAEIIDVGEKICLVATVNKGYNFEGWYIGNVLASKNLEYIHTMQNKDTLIEARFYAYTLSTSSYTDEFGNAGTYTKFQNEKISIGDTVVLSATVNEGYNFDGWFINGICVSNDLEYIYTMRKENVNIEAKFSFYTITTNAVALNGEDDEDRYFSAGHYTEFTGEKISVGEYVTLKATVNEGYNFKGWYINDVCVGTDLEYTVLMERSDVEILAVYSYYTLNTKATYREYGLGFHNDYNFQTQSDCLYTVYNGNKFSIGTTITVKAKIIEGYTFVGWYSSNGLLTTDTTYTFAMPGNDVILFARYE